MRRATQLGYPVALASAGGRRLVHPVRWPPVGSRCRRAIGGRLQRQGCGIRLVASVHETSERARDGGRHAVGQRRKGSNSRRLCGQGLKGWMTRPGALRAGKQQSDDGAAAEGWRRQGGA